MRFLVFDCMLIACVGTGDSKTYTEAEGYTGEDGEHPTEYAAAPCECVDLVMILLIPRCFHLSSDLADIVSAGFGTFGTLTK